MDTTCLFSIIIPVYNGTKVITTCLDSIYSQGLKQSLFEVICVDDCSPDPKCVKTMLSYTYNEQTPSNLHILKNKINKRAGGARNYGLSVAQGRWIVFIDCDDYVVDGSLLNLHDFILANENLDIIVYNYSTLEKKHNIDYLVETEMSGHQFMQTQPVPWLACCYSYKRDFLKNNNINYVEKVFYEDVDFIMRAILVAKSIRFVNIPVYFYNIYEGQTSKLNTPQKVEDILMLAERLKNIGLKQLDINEKSARAVLSHHIFQYESILKRYLWRLSGKDVYRLLKKYKPYNGTFMMNTVCKIPMFYVVISCIFKPFLLLASNVYRRIK